MEKGDQRSFYVRKAVMCHFYSTMIIPLKTLAAEFSRSHQDSPSNPRRSYIDT